ncbi:MAG TPA: hypothetical protein VN665_03125 [Candidatus Paceibacterota bacterium]|nr:hypothetical protein [Candidatus Paceibacterota bacterium]
MERDSSSQERQAEVIPFETERDRLEREEFCRRVEQNRQGNFGDVAKGR